ncbi:MAG: TetR/AcrR family transcriptional regulator [Myxococcota bacterium]
MPRGRPREHDPEAALDAAMEAFWDHGHAGASLSVLLERTGLSKSSFYQTFGSKDELFVQALAHYSRTCFGPMEEAFRKSPSARAFLEGMIRGVADETRGSRRGCLLMNSAVHRPEEPEIERAVAFELRRLEKLLAMAVERGQTEGSVRGEKSAREYARFLVATLAGLKTLVKAGASRAAVREAADVALAAIF